MAKRFYSIYMVGISLLIILLYAGFSEVTAKEFDVVAHIDVRRGYARITYSESDLDKLDEFGSAWDIYIVAEKDYEKFNIPYENEDDDIEYGGNVKVKLKLYDGYFYIKDINITSIDMSTGYLQYYDDDYNDDAAEYYEIIVNELATEW